MSDSTTVRMLTAYRQITETPRFLAGFFASPPRNYHNTEEVEIDILREDEDVAVAVHDITVGPRLNQATVLTNKRFKPPVFKEAGAISAFELIHRAPGDSPFQDPNFQAGAMAASADIVRRLEGKVRRTVELMASQVLQTGALTLVDNNGTSIFTMDFSPKTAHFTTAGTTWAAGAGDPLTNIETVGNLIRKNGRTAPKRLIMGSTAFNGFMKNTAVLSRLDTRRADLGDVRAPQTRGFGGTFHGTISIGNYVYEIWTYDQYYKHPQTGTLTPYVAPEKVIVMGDCRLDLTWGNIPMIGAPDSRVLPFLPRRVSDGERGLDLIQNAYLTPDRENLMVSIAARPLTIPTQIDGFGCITAIV